MTCCILEKRMATTVIPGNPGSPATPGSPAKPAYCATTNERICEWYRNDQITWIGNVPYFNGVPATYYGLVGGAGVMIYGCHDVDVTRCYPAVAAIPGTPGSPPTASQIIQSKNLGWNSWSRAIEALEEDTFIAFTVNANARAVFVGLGENGLVGEPIRSYTHGLLIDGSGVHAYERGVKVHQIAAWHTGATEFQIERRFDGSITYRADAAEYTSTVQADGVLYPVAYMYSAGDRILCAGYTTLAAAGAVIDLDVALPSLGGVLAEGDYTVIGVTLGAPTVAMTGIEHDINTMVANLPALVTVLGEAGYAYAFIDASLGAMTFSMEEVDYVPPVQAEIYGNMPSIAGFIFSSTTETGDIDMTLPALAGVIGEGDYAFIDTSTPPLGGYLVEGVRLDMVMMDGAVATDPMTQQLDLVITLMSACEVSSIQLMQSILTQDYMSTLTAQSLHTMLAEYGVNWTSGLSVRSVHLMELPTGAALNGLGRVWVVNLDTNAASQYDGYAFNSFFTRDGRQYGVADDGIYLLEGDDDAGDAIQAAVELGLYDLGNSRHKSVPSIYLGVASSGRMVVKVVADGEAHVYEARSSSTDLKNHRVDTGRGLKAVNWSFSVLNQNGGDFDLAAIEFLPLVTKRRI